MRRSLRIDISRMVVFGAGSLLLGGCGSYDDAAPAPASGAGGQTTSTGQVNAAGTQAMPEPAMEDPQQPPPAGGGSEGGEVAMSPDGSEAMSPDGSEQMLPEELPMVEMVEASCEAVAPCGGELEEGIWIAAGSCLPVSGEADMSGFGLGCVAAPVSGALEVSGAFIVNADGTFTDGTTTAGETEIALPPECLDVSGTITTCDRVDGALQSLGFAEVTCEEDPSTGGCNCTGTAEQSGGLAMLSLDAASDGTYSTAENVITTSARTDTDYSYCVTGNMMTLTPVSTSRTGTVSGTVVLVKP